MLKHLLLVLLVGIGIVTVAPSLFQGATLPTGSSMMVVTLHANEPHPCPLVAIPASRLNDDAVVGPPTITACLINAVLAHAHSPAIGKGQSLYDLGVKYDIDPVYALAFFLHESSFGTAGEARSSLSLGNLRCIPDYPCPDGYTWFPTWEAGFEAWDRLILYGYVQGQVTIPLVGHTCSTLEQIVPVYAPGSDHNDVTSYIESVSQAVTSWRSGSVEVA